MCGERLTRRCGEESGQDGEVGRGRKEQGGGEGREEREEVGELVVEREREREHYWGLYI